MIITLNLTKKFILLNSNTSYVFIYKHLKVKESVVA